MSLLDRPIVKFNSAIDKLSPSESLLAIKTIGHLAVHRNPIFTRLIEKHKYSSAEKDQTGDYPIRLSSSQPITDVGEEVGHMRTCILRPNVEVRGATPKGGASFSTAGLGGYLDEGKNAYHTDCRQTNNRLIKRAGVKRAQSPTAMKPDTNNTAESLGANSVLRTPLTIMLAFGSNNSGTNESKSMPPTRQNMAPIKRNA